MHDDSDWQQPLQQHTAIHYNTLQHTATHCYRNVPETQKRSGDLIGEGGVHS